MKRINKLSLFLIATCIFSVMSCSKSELNLSNPIEPGEPALNTEEGILRAGLGVYSKIGTGYWWVALSSHNIMGDMTNISVGNFGLRWVNQVSSITLSSGTVLTPPQGGSQGVELKTRNSRLFGEENIFYYEWASMYLANNQANLILSILDGNSVQFTGNAEAKKNTLRAWAYWWKGFAYSRIGSLYVAGIITDKVNQTNNEFKNSNVILAEAAANFDKAMEALNAVSDVAAYNAVMDKVIPSFTKAGGSVRAWNQGGVPSITAWKRQMNSYKARNILVNKKVSELSQEDLNQVLQFTAEGLQSTDRILTMRSANENDLVAKTAWAPFRLLAFPWELLSERWVQEFKAGDARRTRNVIPYAQPQVNVQGRGFQYGTRWTLRSIENGGNYASTQNGLAEIPVAATYEENALTRAEALIRTGAIDAGLQLIDQVRQYQDAQLSPVAGSGLTAQQALAELYSERRIALFLKGTAFYDYRRFGFACKDCQRTGAVVLGPNAVVDNNATILYSYMDYWDVPANELDFNAPSATSANVVFPY